MKVSEKIENEIIDLAIKEMKDVLEGTVKMTNVGHMAFKTIGDYAKVKGAENKEEALKIMRERFQTQQPELAG